MDSNFAKSDDLIWVLKLLERFSWQHNFVKFKLIVDANIVLQDIRWILTKAKSSEVRTGFLELLESEVIDCYAPTFMEMEVREKLEIMSEKYDFDINDGLSLLGRFNSKIELVDVGGPAPEDAGLRDPKDWPYLKLQKKIDVAILTKDKDIAGMGGRAVKHTIVASLVEYARESASSFSIVTAGGAVVVIPAVVVIKAIAFVKESVGKSISRIPTWILVIAVALLVIVVIYPPSREWLITKLATLGGRLSKSMKSLINNLEPFIKEHNESKIRAELSLKKVTECYAE